MKRLVSFLFAFLLMAGMTMRADETITVSANSSDISDGLDLKVVAKLFAQAKNLEEFENLLNNPDSAFCNLDLNGDGEIDYIRVVETGEGSKRLIVLQAILAKDIYQDIASIYVEKDEKEKVTVQVVGDEYIYGTNYVIEPIYVYRPVIYDWLWSPAGYAWTSPWYWDYYPAWWYAHTVWSYDYYWHHCYAFHHHHGCCSFRYAPEPRPAMRDMRASVSRRDYATAHPNRAFNQRNSGVTNARDMRSTRTSVSGVSTRQAAVANGGSTRQSVSGTSTRRSVASTSSRTYGSSNTAAARSTRVSATEGVSTRQAVAGTATSTRGSVNSTSTRANVHSTATSTRTSSTASSRRSSYNAGTTTRTSSATANSTRSSYNSGSSTRSSYNAPARSTSDYGTSTRSSYNGGSSTRSSYGGYSGGGSTRCGGYGGGYSGGGSTRSSGGGGSTRR